MDSYAASLHQWTSKIEKSGTKKYLENLALSSILFDSV
jgi:hypothetical protein